MRHSDVLKRASFIARSDRLNHCCMKCTRSTVSSEKEGRPPLLCGQDGAMSSTSAAQKITRCICVMQHLLAGRSADQVQIKTVFFQGAKRMPRELVPASQRRKFCRGKKQEAKWFALRRFHGDFFSLSLTLVTCRKRHEMDIANNDAGDDTASPKADGEVQTAPPVPTRLCKWYWTARFPKLSYVRPSIGGKWKKPAIFSIASFCFFTWCRRDESNTRPSHYE